MPQRWAIRLAIEGDLRFLSHHEVMRAIERAAFRAELPLRYSQGFNPRPGMSLLCPRPVGLASQDDLLVISLDAPLEAEEILHRLNAHAPAGMEFLRAELLAGRRSPQPVRVSCILPIPVEKRAAIQARLKELDQMDSWCVERKMLPGQASTKTLDLRLLVCELRLEAETLAFELELSNSGSAKPAEVLRLVGLDERIDLARMRRTKIVCEN